MGDDGKNTHNRAFVSEKWLLGYHSLISKNWGGAKNPTFYSPFFMVSNG